MWNDILEEMYSYGMQCSKQTQSFSRWVKTTTLPNVTLGHWKGREVLGVKDSRMDSLVAVGRNGDSHKRTKG